MVGWWWLAGWLVVVGWLWLVGDVGLVNWLVQLLMVVY